ncbi:MAG: T9SS type A sorting domain-containing protein [Bacteroidia bacterium]
MNVAVHAQGSDAFSLSAPDILFNPTTGNLATATKESGCTFGPYMYRGGVTVFADNTLYHCQYTNAACTSGTTTQINRTDFVDLWYKVVLPTGTTRMTLLVTGLGASDYLAFCLYTGNPGASNSTFAVTDAIISASPTNSTASYGGSFFSSTKNSQTILSLTAGETYYVRVMGAVASTTSSAATCSAVPHPSNFTIEAQAPQQNDACNNAINITTNNSGVAHTGNHTAALSEGTDEWNSCPVSTKTAAKDLWYRVNYPTATPTTTKFLTEFNISGVAGQQVRIVVYSTIYGCGSNPATTDVSYCEELTFSGSTYTTTFNSLESTQGQFRRIQIIPIGTVGSVTVSAKAVMANNSCEWFQNVLPGFAITTAQTVNFNYATPSTASPSNTGNDLWYQFSPLSGNNSGAVVYSTSADVAISGLTTGQSLSFYLYKGNGLSSNNCTNLASNFLSQTNVSAGTTTVKLTCLDELHGSADGGYLLRIVQTAGTPASPSITVTPSAVGPFNNDCVNIWDGNGPKNTGTGNAAHSYSAWHVLNGETITGTFANATDCNSSISSATCNSVNNAAITETNDRDVWFTFYVPTNQCATLGLTQSTVISDMKLTYTASPANAFKDAILYVYSDCGDANLMTCSGVLDGAGTAWTATGLTQGQNYLLRVKPSNVNTDFDYPFTIKVDNGVVRPCNDTRTSAYPLAVKNCPDYSALPTYSAKGADDEFLFGQPDVWFTFVAPSPANGNDTWFNINKSWVSVFLENVSGQAITMDLYLAGGTTKASGAETYIASGVGDRKWGKFGNLEPGAIYMIRLRHAQPETTDVLYKIEINAEGNYTPWTCGSFINDVSAKLCGSCGGTPENQTESLCEEWYKIDLPPLTASNMYWVVEVRGFDQVLDFELRSQYLTETSANVGGEDDYDHPCTSRPLESGASMVASIPVDYQVTAGGVYNYVGGEIGSSSCESLGGTAPYGGGFRKVYQGLNGPVFGQKDFYYLRVFMDPDDPNYVPCSSVGTVDIHTCEVIFKGPYLTQATAMAGGTPNANFCTKFDYCDLSSNIYPAIFAFYTDTNEDGKSDNGVWLGSVIDNENDSWGNGAALSDDTNGDDEDGFLIVNPGAPGSTATIRVTGNAVNAGTTVYVGMWIDWDQDGTLEDFYTASGVTASPVTMDINVNVPASFNQATSTAYIRLIASLTPLTATDFDKDLVNGEIEGHTFTPSSLFPVEFMYFHANLNEKNNALLQWATLSETNNDYFDIERSVDGSNFKTLGRVKGIGDSQAPQFYQWEDETRLKEENYYRLKQVDIDGQYKYSATILLKNTNFLPISVYPNPAHDKLYVDYNGGKVLNFSIISHVGQTLSSGDLTTQKYLDISHLPKGIYFLHLGKETFKFIKE